MSSNRTPSPALELAWEAIEALGESYGETYAQHRSECAAFGDSWPGAAIEVANLHRALVEAEAEADHLASVEGFLAEHGPAFPFVYSDDEPF